MIFTNDPLRDFRTYMSEEYLYEQSRPICSECGEHIMSDYLWDFHGMIYCEDCVREHREYIED